MKKFEKLVDYARGVIVIQDALATRRYNREQPVPSSPDVRIMRAAGSICAAYPVELSALAELHLVSVMDMACEIAAQAITPTQE
jgi:hypothetical protein